MASGNTLLQWVAEDGIATGSTFATLDRRAGGSSPAEQFFVADFDAAAIEYLDFRGIIPQNYAGGGYTLRLWWGATTATTGDVVWDAAFRAVKDAAEDIDTSQTYDFNTVTDTAPGTSGQYTAAVITFTDGADADSTAAGDPFIVRLRRNATSVNDTMAGDAELMALELRET